MKTNTLILTLAVLGTIPALPGCRGDRSEKPPRQIFPDMDDSPKYRNQGLTEFFPDGRKMRPVVAGTVPFGAGPHADDPARAGYLREDTAFNTGKGPDGKFLRTIPASVKVDKALILRGQERFNISCSVCHGYTAQGNGMVSGKTNPSYMLVNPADLTSDNYTDPKLETSADGYIFNVIRNGLWDAQGNMQMPAYGHAVTPADAWAIVSYVRTIQASAKGVRAEIPAEVLSELDKQPAAAAPGAPAMPVKPVEVKP